MIFYAKFSGRRKDAIGIFQRISTYCYGEDQASASMSLYDRYEHLTGLELTHCPVIPLSETQDGNHIFLVENDRIVENSAFRVLGKRDDQTCECLRASSGMAERLPVSTMCILQMEGA